MFYFFQSENEKPPIFADERGVNYTSYEINLKIK